MSQKLLKAMIGLLILFFSETLLALEVDREVMPRMTLGGRVITTLDSQDLQSQPGSEEEINLEDSTLLMRFDKRMYSDGVAGAVIGISEQHDEMRFNQLHTFYWNRNYRIELGRSRLRNTVIEFPLLRDDDLLTYTHAGNASSNDAFDQIYGEQLAADWFVDKKIQRAGAWLATRGNGEEAQFNDAPDQIDSVGIRYLYEQPEDLRYIHWIRHAGINFERQKVNFNNENDWMNILIAGFEWNLNTDPSRSWSLAWQIVSNDGIDGVNSPASVAEQAMAKSTSLVLALRYTARPQLLTRAQAGLTFASKDYSDIDNATQNSLAASYAYRIGQGVDLLAQAIYTEYESGLGGGHDSKIQLGLAFSLETMFNDHIGERDSILNVEHGYIQ